MTKLEKKAYAYVTDRQQDPNYPVYNWETEISDAYEQGYKDVIDKAHVWLMENYDKYVRVIGSSIYFAYFELGRDFRKAMEDEQ